MTSVVFNPSLKMRKPAFTPPVFDKLLDDIRRQDWPFLNVPGTDTAFRPAVNILEGEADFRIELAAPGLEKSDFKVEVNKDILTVSAGKEAQSEAEVKILRREFSFLNFQRSFRLPNSVDVNGIQAAYNNGILTVTLPKRDEARVKPPVNIEIA
jgi:HSP20 family protein